MKNEARYLIMVALLVVFGCKSADRAGVSESAHATAEGMATEAQESAEQAGDTAMESAKADRADMTEPAGTAEEVSLGNGLIYQTLAVGEGKLAEEGMRATVHYTGWLTNGTKFDSSVDRGQPFSFVIGKGQVIRGWDEGVKGMRVGGKRKLTIPPQLGYGERGYPGVIPPNATLVFDVELLGVQ